MEAEDYLQEVPGAFPASPSPSAEKQRLYPNVTDRPASSPFSPITPKHISSASNAEHKKPSANQIAIYPSPFSTATPRPISYIPRANYRRKCFERDADGDIEMPDASPRVIKKPTSVLYSISEALRQAIKKSPRHLTSLARRTRGATSYVWPTSYNLPPQRLQKRHASVLEQIRSKPWSDSPEDDDDYSDRDASDEYVRDALLNPEERHLRRKFAKAGRGPDDTVKIASLAYPLYSSKNPQYVNQLQRFRKTSRSEEKNMLSRRRLARRASDKHLAFTGSHFFDPNQHSVTTEDRQRADPKEKWAPKAEDTQQAISVYTTNPKYNTEYQAFEDLTKDVSKIHIQKQPKEEKPLRRSASDPQPSSKPHEDLRKLYPEYENQIRRSNYRKSLDSHNKAEYDERRRAKSIVAQEAATAANSAIIRKKYLEKEAGRQQREHSLPISEEELREEESRKEKAKLSLLIDLNDKWEKQLDSVQALKDPTKEIAGGLSRHDFGTLIPYTSRDGVGWLNDVIIAEYLSYIAKKGREEWATFPDQGPRYHAFNSHFYTKWAKSQKYQDIARWVKRAGLNGPKLLDTKMVFIPIHDNSHWTLLVISGIKKTITYFDSLGGSGKPYLRFGEALVAGTLGNEFKVADWTIGGRQSTQQLNGLDCGVFVCMNALALLKRLTPSDALSANDIPAARRQIAATLINGGFVDDFDF